MSPFGAGRGLKSLSEPLGGRICGMPDACCGDLCILYVRIARYWRVRVVKHDRTNPRAVSAAVVSRLNPKKGKVDYIGHCSTTTVFFATAGVVCVLVAVRANGATNIRRPVRFSLGHCVHVQAHRQREFMEKKQNELVAKLSDAKLAAVKQQASATLYRNIRTAGGRSVSYLRECQELYSLYVQLAQALDTTTQNVPQRQATAKFNLTNTGAAISGYLVTLL